MDELSDNALISRSNAAKKFFDGRSRSTMIRMEEAGVLHPIKLNPKSRSGHTFYTIGNCRAVIASQTPAPVVSRPRPRLLRRESR